MSGASAPVRARTGLIVFGDDRSVYSDRAWLWINNQRWPGWTLDVVTGAVDPADVWSDDMGSEERHWEPEAPRRPFGECGIDKVRHVRSSTDPRLVLGGRSDADLVVIGPRGRFELHSLFSGSTSDHLLHDPPGPVLVAKTSDPARRILVCTDGSVAALQAARVLAALPLAQDATITVLGVVEALGGDRRVVQEGLADAAGVLTSLEVDVALVESEDRAASVILEQAASSSLVVMGSRGTSGLAGAILGSTVNDVARHGTAAVLVVPPLTNA